MVLMKDVARAWALLGFALAVGGCVSGSARTRSVTISEARSGHGVQVAVSEALARELLEGAIGSELRCQGEVDEEFGSVLRALDAGGRGSRATLEGDDGVLLARRTRRGLELSLRGRAGGGRIDAVLPWALAECMLGRSVRLDADVAHVRLAIRGEDGGSFDLHVD
jgi:hypothetical protein